MWTPATRKNYSRNGLRYQSDVTDEEWRVIEPYLPPAKGIGRPRGWPLREIVNGIFYVMRSGCPWRQLPKDLPPWSTVYRWFAAWRDACLFEKINHALVITDRERVGPLLQASRRLFPFIERVFADGGYAGERVATATRIIVEIVAKSPDQIGFAVLPRRWVVERFFAWIGRNRRLAKDFEASIDSARAFLYAASVMLLSRRIARHA